MNWYIGQKVVCITESHKMINSIECQGLPNPEKGHILTINFIKYNYLGFIELHQESAWKDIHFRPLLTDSIEYAEKLLEEITIEINQENLVEK